MEANNSQEHVFAIALRAIALAQSNFHLEVTLEHILASLLERPEIEKFLKNVRVSIKDIKATLDVMLSGFVSDPQCGQPVQSKEFRETFARTVAFSKYTPRQCPDGLDVLFQFVQLSPTIPVVALMVTAGIDAKRIKSYLVQGAKQPHREEYSSETEPNDKVDAVNYIKKYCIDLNELARSGKIEPVIGRLTEIDRITQILARKVKNNVALIGDPGVGKTALAEGLACNIVTGNVPAIFKKSTIWSLDVGSLVAGTRFRGDFEERMKFLLKAFSLLNDEDPSILFIDEIHMIMDAGSGNKGSLDVSNLLKPVLARGKLRCIGSTTDKDWRQHFEKDRALVRRFKKLMVNEPSIEDAKLILLGIRASYEAFHNVKYTDAAVEAAVDLTVRYVHDGKLPDKAIDVIDEAGARQRISDDGAKETIDVVDIEIEVSRVTKIPPQTIHEDETKRLERLENDLKLAVYGQDKALRSLVDAVLISRAGLRDPGKAEGSFLFTGPTGVGKSESARQLAVTLGLPLVKLDMSEYMEKHSVSKLIGSPPGYVGFGDGAAGNGLLINAIDKTPACVLLLDEIEKAHPDVFNILLQVMEDGTLTNSEGKSVSFRNVILIMTSNVGVAKTEQHGMGFIHSDIVAIDDAAVKRMFSPEFRNRLDAIVSFDVLDKISIAKVVNKFIGQLQKVVMDRGITLEITDAAKKWLAEKGYDPVYGARPLGRLIADRIKQPLSRLMLFGALTEGGTVRIYVEDGDLVVRKN